MYSSIKSKVIYCGLKLFYTEYNYLHANYKSLFNTSQGNTQNHLLFPKRLIERGTTPTYQKFNLTKVTSIKGLLDLLPPKQGELYATTYFYQRFTNFSTEHGIFFCGISSYNPDKTDYFL